MHTLERKPGQVPIYVQRPTLSSPVMASSSAHKQQLLPNLYGGATSAPPPTPSSHSDNLLSTSDAADALSRLLHRLPPTLSLPTRRSSPTTSPPVVSLSEQQTLNDDLFSSISQLGFFQLTGHLIAPQLAASSESEALSLFDLPANDKESSFPKNWPLGYEGGDEEDSESFCLDSSYSTKSTGLGLASLPEFSRSLEELGLKVVDLLSKAMGFENPSRDDPTRIGSLMWVSEIVQGSTPVMSGGFYPFIVGLQYQIRCQKYSLLSDSGWVSVLPNVDSVLVTIGDIAQVWSNGKLRKVRGRPVAIVGEEKQSRCITMSLLLTLPPESTVAPLLPKAAAAAGDNKKKENEPENNCEGEGEEEEEEMKFQCFDFEDYAWRVHHERLTFKDPLNGYRLA